jgi:hypothetical protein
LLSLLGMLELNTHGRFRASQTIAKSIEQYSNQLESMFVEEMFPRDPQETLDQDVARPSAWLTKAKLAVQGDKKVEPFVFQPEVRRCLPVLALIRGADSTFTSKELR